jgi:hypothetical protein
MSKKVLIALLVVFLAGGGIAFAQYGPGNGFLGLNTTPPEIEDEEDGRGLGEEVSKQARDIDLSGVLPDQAQKNENGENRSPVAEAVLDVLGNGKSPEDGAAFGEEVSKQAQDDGRALGKAVSDAARGASGGAGAGNR